LGDCGHENTAKIALKLTVIQEADSFASRWFEQNKVPQKSCTPMLKSAISATHRQPPPFFNKVERRKVP
jgi:hypothetical protein